MIISFIASMTLLFKQLLFNHHAYVKHLLLFFLASHLHHFSHSPTLHPCPQNIISMSIFSSLLVITTSTLTHAASSSHFHHPFLFFFFTFLSSLNSTSSVCWQTWAPETLFMSLVLSLLHPVKFCLSQNVCTTIPKESLQWLTIKDKVTYKNRMK